MEAGTPRQSAARSAATKRDELLYVYGVLLAGPSSKDVLAGRNVLGIVPFASVTGINHAGLIAATSLVPAAVFDEEPLNALTADLPKLAEYAVRHEAVVRTLFEQAGPIVPLGFGAVYRSPEGVRAMLEGQESELHALLEKVADREEWGLKAYADPARVWRAAEQNSAVLRELAVEIERSAPGKAYLLRRRRESLLATEASGFLDEELSGAARELGAASVDVQQDAVVSETPDPHPLVAKLAFLVDRDHREAFGAVFAGLLDRAQTAGLDLELSGPWPPYSFVRKVEGQRGAA